MSPVLRACVICGTPFQPTGPGQSRCPQHPKHIVPRTRQYRNKRDRVIANASVCGICGKPFTDPTDPPVVDHIEPRAYGGTDDETNLQAAHRSCNGRKGAQMPSW
jgi:5-methylcytosine-specific restriction endonuclease McrA